MLIRFGEYCLDTEEMSLQVNEQSVVLEPKVFAVLIYFIEHNNRYISMEELHTNLWKDRCVSDAAVRRIISKIRLILNDDYKDPKYLQSLSKRGYKLICPVSASPSPIEEKKQKNIEIIDHKKVATNKVSFSFVAIVIFFLSSSYLLFENKVEEALVVTKVVNTVASDKKSFAVSSGGRYIAFASKLSHEKHYQIYLKDRKTQTIEVLVDNTILPAGLVFSNDGERLYFSDNLDDVASLKQVSLKNKTHEIDTLLADFYFISDVFVDKNEDNAIYFSGQKSLLAALLIYKFNSKKGSLEEVTSAAQKGAYDSHADISPDSNKLVVLRVYLDSKRNSIRVRSLKTGSTIFHHDQNTVIYDVQWLDDEHIILLDDKKLAKINIKTGHSYTIIDKNDGLIALERVTPNKLLAIRDNDIINTLIEKKPPLSDFKNVEMIQEKQPEQDSSIIAYQPLGNKVWMVIKEKGVRSLIFYEKSKATKKFTLMSTEKPLELLSPSRSGRYILLKLQNRITILNTFDNSLTYLSKADELIGDVTFSLDEKSILYTRKSNGEWQVFEHAIKENTKKLIFKGYRFIRQFEGGYVLGDGTGKLSRFDTYKETTSPMQVSVSTEVNTNWAIINDKILWSNHNLINTTFYEVDLSDVDASSLKSRTFDFSVIRPRFYVDKVNSLIVVERLGSRSSEIISIDIQ
jgi:DNA-binding winged helix-turn-helix (wHTH) protein/archaellum component FlaF (FlaF/FlaG flagellin family)